MEKPLRLSIDSSRRDSQETWRLLDLEFEDPYLNMAVEEAIARSVGEGIVATTLRYWRNVNAVVIGSHQDYKAEADLQLCTKYGTALVRRFTGGGAVYHDLGNLNFAISLPRSHRLVKDDILETFEDLSLAVVRGLRHLGLENALLENGNCILVNGRKLSGLAGCIRWGAFFCHGSILISPDIHRLTEVLLSTQYSEERWVRSMPRAITTISHELGRTVSLPDVKMALRRGFEDAFGIEIVDGSLSAQESYVAKRLLHHKYGTQKWNNNLLDM